MDILTIVADSCRYDTYLAAKATAIRKHFDVLPATAQATFTYPAHLAMFAGFYPSVNGSLRPLYDRFTLSVFRWFYTFTRPHLIELEPNSSIPKSLLNAGWSTQCIGGVGWFKNGSSLLADGFELFRYESDLNVAVNTVIGSANKKPRYCVINSGITHRPYNPPTHTINSPRSGCDYKLGYNKELHMCQAASLDYVSECLNPLFDYLLKISTPTLVCFCADHGDCFGEDGCFGHGFYHPKVMEVPLAWSCFAGGRSFPVNVATIDNVKRLIRG